MSKEKEINGDTPALENGDAIVMPPGAVAPVATTRAGVLVEKQQELGSIVNVIEVYARKLSKKEKAEVDAIEAAMSQAIQDHLIESRIIEADIKIGFMRQVAELVQRKSIKK